MSTITRLRPGRPLRAWPAFGRREVPFVGPWGTLTWVLALGAIAIVVGFTGDLYTQSLLGIGGAFVVAAIGYNIVLGYAGQLAFGHSGFMALGAYTYAVMADRGYSAPIAIFAGLVLSGVVAALVGVSALRVSHLYLALITLAFAQAINVLASVMPITGRSDGIVVDLWGDNAWLIAVVAAVAVLLFTDRLIRSPLGRAFVVVREDEEAAVTMGVPRVYVKTLAFVISGVLGGAGGILLGGALKYITPQNFNVHVTLFVLTMLVIGGLGSLVGTVAGVVLLVYVQYAMQVPPGSLNIMYGAILLVVIIVLPGGLVSIPQRAKQIFAAVRDRRNR